MKKKVMFMLINMNIGGTEKALLNMISEMPEEKNDITILLLEEYGGFLDSIPKHVQVDYLPEYCKIKGILNQPLHKLALSNLKTGKFINSIIFFFLYCLTKIMKDRSPLFKYVLRDIHEINIKYDVAVAYAGPMDFISYFIINKVKAEKKIQWIHFDVTKVGFNKKFAKKQYENFDRIYAVSNEAKNKLIELIPKLKLKTEVFFNIVSEKALRIQAKKTTGFKDNFSGLRILTIGRLANEKGQDLAVNALKKLLKDGYDVKWYCVGEGDKRAELEKQILANGLEDRFILLGAKTNPYPYLDQCDLYVQPSRYEGYCLTIIEAKYLYKPIIATNVNGVREQIIDGKTGFIVKDDENAIYKSLRKLLDFPEIRQKFSRNLASEKIEESKVSF